MELKLGADTSFPPVTTECSNCDETKDFTDFPKSALTATCKHPPTTCLQCIAKSINTAIRAAGPGTKIQCHQCAGLLEYDAVLLYADVAVGKWYEVATFCAALEADQSFVWCASGCGSGQTHDSGVDNPIVKRGYCGHRTCFQHKFTWHEGVTCDEWDAQHNEPAKDTGASVEAAIEISKSVRSALQDIASEVAIQKTTKKCPTCRQNIEKSGGW
ncbi:hypothetical protein B0T17DRAFT_485225 [Bombardia bombarda]|uniref:RBR-type E3 ubiquitin transferase n=1 Tax=Bombardia bombarda TaxID=252184 RepID=A0AA40CGU3_9PEZI|nr:hypothetical protein B0T17DRAFT_485225 [Bombardia bombarda]